MFGIILLTLKNITKQKKTVVFSISYFTTNTYQLKREIVNFSKKICKNSNKPTSKFVTDMLYGISKSKDIILSSISEALDENISKINTIDRLSNNLSLDLD